MTKEYTVDELSAKIEAIKAERERTANALKRYEEELERRKLEVPLGVPFTKRLEEYYAVDVDNKSSFFDDNCEPFDLAHFESLNYFKTEESSDKHAEMLLAWRKALVANAKGEPIDIKVLCPLLSKGNVCCTYSGKWFYSEDKITLAKDIDCWIFSGTFTDLSSAFNIKPALDWRNSLTECGL